MTWTTDEPRIAPAAEPVQLGETLPGLLFELAEARSNQVAVQEKLYGIWQPTTWQGFAERVTAVARGLAGIGVSRGEVVAVISDNRPEWLIAELAVQSLGAAIVGIYPSSVGPEIVHILTAAEVRVVVAEDQEQVDKLIRLKADLPLVQTILYYAPRGLKDYEEPFLRDFAEIEAEGRKRRASDPGQTSAAVADDVAVICVTSGTTGVPKLVELTHANLLAMTENLCRTDDLRPHYRYVSFALAWIGEQVFAVACGLYRGLTISFPEDASTQRDDLREIGPDVMFSPPPVWESMMADVHTRLDGAGRLSRSVFSWAYSVGHHTAELRSRGDRPGPSLRLQHRIADAVALRAVREQLGLVRLKRAYTGSAPLRPDVLRFFRSIGINLKQIYGQTESCGIAVLHRDDDVRFDTVGSAAHGTELRIADDGEILLRSAMVFARYHKNPEATAQAIDSEGWLHTGDIGSLEEGHLVVVGRTTEVRRTPHGEQFSATLIEDLLKRSPYVDEAVVVSGSSDAVVHAIVVLDPVSVGAWAETKHLSHTTFADLAADATVRQLIAGEARAVSRDLPEGLHLQRFVLLHKQLDPDDGEITRTLKVRRFAINERFAEVVAALYRGDQDVTIRSAGDGATSGREISLRVCDLSTGVGDE